MFWRLLLAHFLADFPLQPNWIVQNKRKPWALSLHVFIHFITMIALAGPERALIWLPILILAVAHFFIDIGKNLVNRYQSNWVVGPYLIDQLLHFISIFLASSWIVRIAPQPALLQPNTWLIFAIGYLFVSYVWFITERTISYRKPAYVKELQLQLWPRMLIRAALLTFMLFLGKSFPLIAMAIPAVDRIPYLSGEYRLRAISTDLFVALAVMLFIHWAT